jgi:hypothetical protein
MTCFAVLLLAWIVLFVGVGLAVGLISIAAALIIIAVVVALAFLLYFWRVIYPWLVRMGRWAAQLRNSLFLLALLIGVLALWYLLGQADIQIPGVVLYAVLIPLGVLFGFLLLLGLVVWVVRLWRYTWPIGRNFFWDIWFRIVALFWKILVGIPIGIIWFFYHPPLRWLVAALLFYLRGVSAAVAWLLYNPPLRDITAAVLFVTRLIGRVVAAILYNPPILWLVQLGLFNLRLIARFLSTIIYGIWSWWPFKGVRGMLRKGLTVESKSYKDYNYAQDDGSGAA